MKQIKYNCADVVLPNVGGTIKIQLLWKFGQANDYGPDNTM